MRRLTNDGTTTETCRGVLDKPPATMNQVQALDLGIFGIQKAYKARMIASKDLSQNSKNLKQIIDSWHKATVPGNMVQPFHQAGFYKQ